MKVTQHGRSLYKLTRLWFFNCYLVVEEDGLTLIDTNMPGSEGGILQAAQALDAPIRRIALTHAHIDHAGSLDALAGRLPEAQVLATSRSAQFMRGELALLPEEPQAALKGGFPRCTTRPAQLLAPGDKVGSLEVIAAPGHTPDHVAFFDARDGCLIAGDALQTQGGVAVAGDTRWAFPFPGMATWHRETALDTVRHLQDLRPSRVAVGHGRVLEEPAQALEMAIQSAQKSFNLQTA